VRNTTLNCETETVPVQVTVLALPVADFSVKTLACASESLTFTNQATADNRVTAVYSWNFGDGNISLATNPIKVFATAKMYNTSLTVSYSGVSGCSNVKAVPITISASTQPVISPEVISLCPDEEATLSISGTFSSISWSNGSTTSSTTVTGPGIYRLTTTDTNGCPGQDEVVIGEKPVPVVTAIATPSSIAAGETSKLVAEGADTYAWSPIETLDNPTAPDPIASPMRTTTYAVIGTTTDGCSAIAEVIVTVQGNVGFPAAFSPNGDGMFDEWNIRAQERPDCTISIYDTRGRKVFEGKGENWDGTWNGKPVPVETYYYIFRCPDEKPITGNVLVIR
jgi:gliding motility-associated-like protein